MTKAQAKEIPEHIWSYGIGPVCVEYWYDHNLKRRINALLPVDWGFVSLIVTERDLFGPVCGRILNEPDFIAGKFARLTLMHHGEIYQGVI